MVSGWMMECDCQDTFYAKAQPHSCHRADICVCLIFKHCFTLSPKMPSSSDHSFSPCTDTGRHILNGSLFWSPKKCRRAQPSQLVLNGFGKMMVVEIGCISWMVHFVGFVSQ